MIFVEHDLLGERSARQWTDPPIPHLVNATHWYDAVTLFSQRTMSWWSFDAYTGRFVIGRDPVRRMFADQLGAIKAASQELMGGCPTLIGEFGLPFNLDGRRGLRTGDYRAHTTLLTSYYEALDHHLLSATQWNYTADNDHRWGDQWNREDLSIYSRDDRHLGDDGARALRGFCRPYARVTAGTPYSMHYDYSSGEFELRYQPDLSLRQPTEIFVPVVQYPEGYAVELSSGHAEQDEHAQLVRVWAVTNDLQTVIIRPGLSYT
jgi:hypothetical protein